MIIVYTTALFDFTVQQYTIKNIGSVQKAGFPFGKHGK